MPAYHSSFLETPNRYGVIGNIALLPIKTKVRGPAPVASEHDGDDIIDEAITLFRANCLFRNFEIKGPADRTLIYLLLFIQECLGKLQKLPPLQEALRILNSHALASFPIPGEPGFVLSSMYQSPGNRNEADNMRAYLSQLRQEAAIRFPQRIYVNDKPSKWWISFSKRKFMNLNGVTP